MRREPVLSLSQSNCVDTGGIHLAYSTGSSISFPIRLFDHANSFEFSRAELRRAKAGLLFELPLKRSEGLEADTMSDFFQ